LCLETGHKPGEAWNLCALAEVYTALGDHKQAVEYLQAVDEQLREIDDRSVRVQYLNTLGTVRYELGDYTRALQAYKELAEEAESGYFLAQSKLGLARAYAARDKEGDRANAQRYAAEAIDLCRELQLAGDLPRGYAYLGKVSLLADDRKTALQECREAVCLLDTQRHVHGSEAEIYLIAIQVLAANGLEEERSRYLEQAYSLVHTTAAKIEDEALRRSYLAMPVNREIVETWVRDCAEKTA
jgi:tetratricopeptide (TPR) repeat protein